MVQGPRDSIEELLPAYALNALDADERDLVERALADSPRHRAALAEYLEGFAQLAESQVVLLPSLDLRDRIMAAAGARGPAQLAMERGRRESPRPAFGGWWTAAAAASVLVFLGLGGLAMAQSFRVNDLEAEMVSLSASAAATQASLDGQKEEMATLSASAAVTQTEIDGQREEVEALQQTAVVTQAEVDGQREEMEALQQTAVVTQAEIDGQREEMEALQETAAETEAKLISQQELTYFVAQEGTSLTRMWAMATPQPSAKPPRGMLIADIDGGRLLMTLSLRPLESWLAYQAWVFESDESAFSIAVFVVDHSGFALVPVDFPGSDVQVNWVSVYIAPAGGDAAPTGRPVLGGAVEFR